jgi:DNA-binding CsgD family transcriptional regulator/ligand-binding sensor domain-containing protein
MILPNEHGDIFVGRAGEFFLKNGNQFQETEPSGSFGEITSAIQLRNGGYVIGTQNSGLYILNQDLTMNRHLTRYEGLSDRTVKALFQDKFQNLWVALNYGIDYLELRLPLSLINEDVGVEGTGYAACNFKNKVYLGTNNGLFSQQTSLEKKQPGLYEVTPGSEGQVYSFSTVEGDLILNHDRGAFQVHENGITQFYDIGSWKFLPTSVPGLILNGGYRGISFFNKKNNVWTKTAEIPNFNESCRVLEYENDSTLWMTHSLKGAYRFSFDNSMNLKDEPMQFGFEHGFPSNKKISVYALDQNLVFTAEHGIYNYDNVTLSFDENTFFTKWLGDMHVSEIVSDKNNSIYYIQNGAMGMLEERAFGNYERKTGIFKHINKYLNDDLPNISIIDENNILIGAKEGFILYNPDQKFSINENFKVFIRSVEINFDGDSTITYYSGSSRKLAVDADQSLRFIYTSPYFDGFEDLKYSYRLIPLEENWSNWSASGKMEYPYLPPGNYTFEVKAKNVYDHQSMVSTFNFQVLEPWYYTMWAKIFYVLFGLTTVIIILAVQKRKHTAESHQITEKSEQALKSKDEEIGAIMSEKLKTEINLKNDQLTTVTMHLMNTTDLLQTVRDKIQSLKKQDNDGAEMENVVKLIDDKISDQNSWDQFAYHFDQVHSGYLKKLSESNVNLSPREIKLASFLRMNMSSKEISKLLNISDRGVELARYRLRKKLNLSRDQNLVEYLIDLDN